MKKASAATRKRPKGFALVITLAFMVLLVILAVGMLGLSAVAVRTSARQDLQAEARANARVALMLALGELQKQTGADTRITAPADIIEDGAPPIVGAWRSWEGLNHETSGVAAGRPIAPDYSIKEQPAGTGDGRFLAWLISGAVAGGNLANPSALAQAAAAADGSTVPLLAEGTLGANPGQVHVAAQALGDRGSFAWWISAENQKARLAQPHEPRVDDAGGWVAMGQSHSVPDPGVFGLDALADDREGFRPEPGDPKPASRAITLASTELIAGDEGAEPQHSFHDLSTSAIGLLTNSATGGWRKDLSVLTEKWDAIYAAYPGARLPMFRYLPEAGATSFAPKPTGSNYDPAQSNLYPWSEYSTILGYKQPATYYAASASWASLQSFATSYKGFTYSSGDIKSPFVWDKMAKQRESSVTATEHYNHKHRQRLHPQIARFQVIFYATAVEAPLNQNPKRYRLRYMFVPFVTLWNPYNVTLEHTISGTLNGGQNSGTHQNFLGIGWRRSLPGAMAVVDRNTYPNPDLVPTTQFRLFTNGNFQTLDWPNNFANPYDNQLPGNVGKFGTSSIWRDLRTWALWLPEGTLTFKPGEAKIFSPEWLDTGYGFGGGAFRMKEGYDPTSLVGRDFDSTSNLLAERSFWFLFRNDRVTQPYRDRAPGYGFSLSFGDGGSHFGGTAVLPSGIGDEFHNITALVAESEGDTYWPPDEIDEVGYSVAELVGQWVPMYSASFGVRTTIGTGPGTNQNRPTKGAVQSNALASMVLSDPASGKGKDHPANNTFDFAFHSLTMGSTITPNLSESEGYIATGYQSGDGLSRLVLCNVPLRPMSSLVELEGWNPRGNNPYPPFQMNLIGNSDATPLIPQDKVVPNTLEPAGAEFNLQHDDAYCANHLLFDDWFVSSIAPQPRVLGGDIAKDIETFYSDVLTGEDRLSNRAYRPIREDSNLTPAEAAERVDEILNSPDGWLTIASRLEVDGMFNVNSTSVAAWKAILGHAKNREKIALHGEDGISSTTASTGHAVTRGAIATDVEAGTGAGFGAHFANAAEFTGFRSLTEEQIEDLAQKIVEQVRLRGPFLSLSEFVNRRLSADDGMALAGAVQTAIDSLDDDPMAELRDPANSLSSPTMEASDPKLDGVDYAYARAAEGDSAHGAPGWIRQADVLRPIAPILSARDDTFTIRAYADVRSQDGTTVLAKAWCEAVVVRSREFCDETDSADSAEPPSSPANATFGRKYRILSFRWLNESEV